jgi:hemerythrin-like domain-containing protein
MLIQLRFGSTPDSPRDAFGLLLDCHERIRAFSRLALQLVRPGEIPRRDVAEAAGRLERYFSLALPLHVADEDESLAPMLRQLTLPPRVFTALAEMTRQHHEIEALLGALITRWRFLRELPEAHAELLPKLRPDTERLAELLERHLALEEGVVFPLARERLRKESVEQLAAEMRLRRGQKADGTMPEPPALRASVEPGGTVSE